jgi:hypothetical protein
MDTSKYRDDLVDRIQRFVADTCVDVTMLRCQGPDVARKIIGYLGEHSDMLAEFAACEPNGFGQRLDEQTQAVLHILKPLVPGKGPWGTVRKALNIYLRSALYNCFLRDRYGLERLETLFEIPLDSRVANGLRAEPEGKQLKAWPGLKYLKKEQSDLCQACALKVAQRKQLPARVYLDHEMWARDD